MAKPVASLDPLSASPGPWSSLLLSDLADASSFPPSSSLTPFLSFGSFVAFLCLLSSAFCLLFFFLFSPSFTGFLSRQGQFSPKIKIFHRIFQFSEFLLFSNYFYNLNTTSSRIVWISENRREKSLDKPFLFWMRRGWWIAICPDPILFSPLPRHRRRMGNLRFRHLHCQKTSSCPLFLRWNGKGVAMF